MSEQRLTEYRPPGWYSDPSERHGVRWWDGAQWGQQAPPLRGQGQESRHLHPPQQLYGQQPLQPSFTPKSQHGTPPGQSAYQGQLQYPPQSYGQDPYQQGQPSYDQQPNPPQGHRRNSRQEAPRKRRRVFLWVFLGIQALFTSGSSWARPLSTPVRRKQSSRRAVRPRGTIQRKNND